MGNARSDDRNLHNSRKKQTSYFCWNCSGDVIEDDKELCQSDQTSISQSTVVRPPLCSICFSRMVEIVYFPCGHCVTCQTCTEIMESNYSYKKGQCPICRGRNTTGPCWTKIIWPSDQLETWHNHATLLCLHEQAQESFQNAQKSSEELTQMLLGRYDAFNNTVKDDIQSLKVLLETMQSLQEKHRNDFHEFENEHRQQTNDISSQIRIALQQRIKLRDSILCDDHPSESI